MRYAVNHAVGMQAASTSDMPAGTGTTLRRGTATRSANVPGWRSDSSERFGSSVSSPRHWGSEMTEWTTTSVPSSSSPAASQPKIIGSRSAGSPTPRSDQRSWWFRLAARTRTETQSGGTSGSGCSPTTSPCIGSSASCDAAYTANMRPT